jgi:hypothetical protein
MMRSEKIMKKMIKDEGGTNKNDKGRRGTKETIKDEEETEK